MLVTVLVYDYGEQCFCACVFLELKQPLQFYYCSPHLFKRGVTLLSSSYLLADNL